MYFFFHLFCQLTRHFNDGLHEAENDSRFSLPIQLLLLCDVEISPLLRASTRWAHTFPSLVTASSTSCWLRPLEPPCFLVSFQTWKAQQRILPWGYKQRAKSSFFWMLQCNTRSLSTLTVGDDGCRAGAACPALGTSLIPGCLKLKVLPTFFISLQSCQLVHPINVFISSHPSGFHHSPPGVFLCRCSDFWQQEIRLMESVSSSSSSSLSSSSSHPHFCFYLF